MRNVISILLFLPALVAFVLLALVLELLGDDGADDNAPEWVNA